MKYIARRSFLKKSAGTAAALTAWQIIPRHVLGRGQTPPSEKVNIAGIGIGGQGGHDIRQLDSENIVALCDVDQRRATGLLKAFPKAAYFQDYRKMLDGRKEIDAVVVGTPDHMHAFASIAAMQHGKHVYCEKPLTHSVWEARHVATYAREKKLATQMGNQGQASAETRALCEMVWMGVIGPIREVHIWTDRPSQGLFNEYWPQGVGRPTDTPPVPVGMNWDLWIGPSPMDPCTIRRTTRSNGAAGGISEPAPWVISAAIPLDPVFRALKLGHPTWVQASSTRVNTETYPLGSIVTYTFPARSADPQKNNAHLKGLSGPQAGAVEMPAVKLGWYDGGLRPPRPEGLPEDRMMGDNGRLLIGEKGFILGTSVYPESLRSDIAGKTHFIPQSPGHYREFVNACKGQGPAGSNFDFAGPLAEVVLLGNVALRSQLREPLTRHKLMWDPVDLKITNLPEANQFLRREYRQGWTLV